MKKSEIIVLGVVLLLALSSCISSTTGPPKSERNDDDASDLNYQLGARYYFNEDYDLARDRLELSLEQNPDNAIGLKIQFRLVVKLEAVLFQSAPKLSLDEEFLLGLRVE